MPERIGKAGDGIAEDTDLARQARTARDEHAGTKAPMLIDQVVCRANLIQAHERVVRNGGAPGVDGMTVDDLMPYCSIRSSGS